MKLSKIIIALFFLSLFAWQATTMIRLGTLEREVQELRGETRFFRVQINNLQQERGELIELQRGNTAIAAGLSEITRAHTDQILMIAKILKRENEPILVSNPRRKEKQ